MSEDNMNLLHDLDFAAREAAVLENEAKAAWQQAKANRMTARAKRDRAIYESDKQLRDSAHPPLDDLERALGKSFGEFERGVNAVLNRNAMHVAPTPSSPKVDAVEGGEPLEAAGRLSMPCEHVPEEFTLWSGGERPVSASCVVDAIYYEERLDRYYRGGGPAGELNWTGGRASKTNNLTMPVVAFRVNDPQQEPAVNGPFATSADLAKALGATNEEANEFERNLNRTLPSTSSAEGEGERVDMINGGSIDWDDFHRKTGTSDPAQVRNDSPQAEEEPVFRVQAEAAMRQQPEEVE